MQVGSRGKLCAWLNELLTALRLLQELVEDGESYYELDRVERACACRTGQEGVGDVAAELKAPAGRAHGYDCHELHRRACP